MVNPNQQPDTDLELLTNIFTPKVPEGDGYDHITKDIVLSNFSRKDVNYICQVQELIALLKYLELDICVDIAKQQFATFINAMRGKDGFERKQQTTSVGVQKISVSGSGAKETLKRLTTGGQK